MRWISVTNAGSDNPWHGWDRVVAKHVQNDAVEAAAVALLDCRTAFESKREQDLDIAARSKIRAMRNLRSCVTRASITQDDQAHVLLSMFLLMLAEVGHSGGLAMMFGESGLMDRLC
jgi:hypothetical protein